MVFYLTAPWHVDKFTIIDHNPKWDGKGKASGLENLRPYHRMESMRKSNILS